MISNVVQPVRTPEELHKGLLVDGRELVATESMGGPHFFSRPIIEVRVYSKIPNDCYESEEVYMLIFGDRANPADYTAALFKQL